MLTRKDPLRSTGAHVSVIGHTTLAELRAELNQTETANGFAMDIGRYLNDEPVLASPPSVGYRVSKFARRNKGVLTTTAVVAREQPRQQRVP